MERKAQEVIVGGSAQRRLLKFLTIDKEYDPLERPVQNDSHTLPVTINLALQQIIHFVRQIHSIFITYYSKIWIGRQKRSNHYQWLDGPGMFTLTEYFLLLCLYRRGMTTVYNGIQKTLGIFKHYEYLVHRSGPQIFCCITGNVFSRKRALKKRLRYHSADEKFDSTIDVNAVVQHTGDVLYVPPGIFKSICPFNIATFPFVSFARNTFLFYLEYFYSF